MSLLCNYILQVPEEEETMESNESTLPHLLPSDKDYQRLAAVHFKQVSLSVTSHNHEVIESSYKAIFWNEQ